MLVSCVQYSNLIFLQIILPQVIIKYWPYSLFCTLHPCNLLILFLAVFNLLLPPSPILKVKVNQPCPTLCDPMDYRVHEILQARILEWVAYTFFRGSSWPRNWTRISWIASLVAQVVKCPPEMEETRVQFLGWKDPLEKEMATHSSTLAWKIPWMEEPGRLQSMWSQRVGHRLSDFTFPFLLHCRQILYQLSSEGSTYFTPPPYLFPLVTTSLVFVSISLFCFA